jgi:hypothetical protein
MTNIEPLRRLDDTPEPMESLQARWPAALVKLWNIDDPAYDVNRGPGKYREHVFDLSNGFRFIVSREQYALVNGSAPYLHVSASFRAGSAVEQIVAGGRSIHSRRRRFCRLACREFAEITGLKLPEEPWHVTSGGIPHWKLDCPAETAE